LKATPKTPAQRRARTRAVAKPPPPGDSRHGINCYTNYGCRCDIGRAANAAVQAAYKARRAARCADCRDRPRAGTACTDCGMVGAA
jgi:hypothetical protein